MAFFTRYKAHKGSREGKHYKDTLFNGDYLMIGINCLDPGQVQPAHVHDEADKVYIVMEGEGLFVVGTEMSSAAGGSVIWAPAGVEHGVENRGAEPLVMLVGIAPPPTPKE